MKTTVFTPLRAIAFQIVGLTTFFRAVVSVIAGNLTVIGLILLSWLTAENFLAEGADTPLSRLFMSPLEFVSGLLSHLTGIQKPLLLAIIVSILVVASICYLCIRWLLVPFVRSQSQESHAA